MGIPLIAQRDAVGREGGRRGLDCRIKVALELAIANSVQEAFTVLLEVRPAIKSRDKELSANYFQAYAIAKQKNQEDDEAFEAFEHALASARAHNDLRLIVRILNNYGTAAAISGNVEVAIHHLEEALAEWRRLVVFAPLGILSLAQATFTGGLLERTKRLMHEFYAVEDKGPSLLSCSRHRQLLAACSVAIPTAIMLGDSALLGISSDRSLIDLGFAIGEQSLLGRVVEAFCMLFECEKRREAHDELLGRFTDSVQSFDDSLDVALRIARLGSARHLPRMNAIMTRQCRGASKVRRAYKALFESFIAARRNMLALSSDLAKEAASVFRGTGRPLQEAVAFEAAGYFEEADAIRDGCGVRTPFSCRSWVGAPIPRQLAEALTPRETEIANLAAKGLTNRDIAAQLGLSQRTVQHHCEAIFSKLGIRSRWQLS